MLNVSYLFQRQSDPPYLTPPRISSNPIQDPVSDMTEEEIKEDGEPGEIAETLAYGGIVELAPGMRFT